MIPGFLAAAIGAAGLASAAEDHARQVLMRIEPNTRLEQACDLEVMNRIGRTTRFRPDRAKSDVTVPPVHMGDTMTAAGGAFRSRGKWYALTLACTGTADHTKVLSLSFKIGAEIPERRWAALSLWP